MLHIFLVPYNKPTFKNVHLEVDDYELLDILCLFFTEMKYFKKIN